MEAILVSAKVSVLTARSTRLSPSLPKGSTWDFIETKAIKHDYNISLIMRHTKTVMINIGLSPNKRFSLMPFS